MSNDNLFENVNWDRFLNPLKKYTFLGIAMLGMILSLQMGASPFQVVLGLGALGLYAAFPNEISKWYESNQGILIGGALGFFWAPPFGLPLGALLGHFLHDKYIKILNAANQVKEVVRPIVAPGNWLKEKAVDPVVSSGLWLKDKAGGLLTGAVNGISNALSDAADAFESAADLPLYESQGEPSEQVVPAPASIAPAPVMQSERSLILPPAEPILAASRAEENPAVLPASPSHFDNLVSSGRSLANRSLTLLNTASNIKQSAAPLYQHVTSALQNVGTLIPESPVSTREVISAGKNMINNSLSYLKSWWPSHNEGEEEVLRANAPVYFASQGPGAMQEGPAPERRQTRAAARLAREESSSTDEPRRSSRKRKKAEPFTII
jgi:hypothetical protein